MKEAAFIKQNKARWDEYEKVILNQHQAQPDKLADLFIQLTDDLAFARTQYPDSNTTQYLNNMASRIHLVIYKNKREEVSRFATFWKFEVPAEVANAHKPMLYSLIIFLVTALIGVVSSMSDETFVRLIMGDGYVNQTLDNIKNGNPTAIYGDSGPFEMFLYITFNNIMVSFYTFIYGIFTSIGTAFILFRNGVMVGSFVTMFHLEGEFAQAFPVIMLHGTIELSSIVVAGGAGFVMGNSILFPGTYSRLESFKRGARRGLKIVVGLIPFIITAGFIESFVTRYAFMHWAGKTLIILFSALLMIWYFIIYPLQLKKNGKL